MISAGLAPSLRQFGVIKCPAAKLCALVQAWALLHVYAATHPSKYCPFEPFTVSSEARAYPATPHLRVLCLIAMSGLLWLPIVSSVELTGLLTWAPAVDRSLACPPLRQLYLCLLCAGVLRF